MKSTSVKLKESTILSQDSPNFLITCPAIEDIILTSQFIYSNSSSHVNDTFEKKNARISISKLPKKFSSRFSFCCITSISISEFVRWQQFLNSLCVQIQVFISRYRSVLRVLFLCYQLSNASGSDYC